MMEFLRRALDPPWTDDEIRVITTPAPVGNPEALLRPGPEPAFFWGPSDGPPFSGLGAAALVEGRGHRRGEDVVAGADRLWPRVRVVAPPGVEPLPVRLYGGLAFGTGPQPAAWQTFGEAAFMLPRLAYTHHRRDARIGVVVSAEDWRSQGSDRWVRQACEALDALAAGPGLRGAAPEPVGHAPDPPPAAPGDAAAWAGAVGSIQRRIARGRAHKIVAARARQLTFEVPPDPSEVLRHLAGTTAAARFAFRFGGATFLGAAPERLVRREGLSVRSEAVAGSMPAGPAHGADALLASGKDTVEHAYVVRAIADQLEPLCDRLEYPDRPHIRQVGPVLHLHTPFDGLLTRPVPALELALRLHPTPAVGGTPTREALDWIGREERTGRGWYAAPVGWFDRDGDGDFVVALRCGLLEGRGATLFAGAGIVEESDAAAEYSETELKLRTMLEALGPFA